MIRNCIKHAHFIGNYGQKINKCNLKDILKKALKMQFSSLKVLHCAENSSLNKKNISRLNKCRFQKSIHNPVKHYDGAFCENS